MKSPRIVVIGAGAGGLASAICLASAGARVTVLEQQPAAGGKIRSPARADLTLDVGPTVMTMPWVFADLFQSANRELTDELALAPLDTLAHHRWTGGEQLNLYADKERSVDAIGRFAGARCADEYQRFADRSRQVYELLEATFITRQQRGLPGLLRRCGWRRLPQLWRINAFRSLWHDLGGAFSDPRLRQLFARYSTYCGSSPLLAPSTLMLIAHVERTGVWRIEGGMLALAGALTRCAESLGVDIRRDTRVQEIDLHKGRVAGVVPERGERLAADCIVVNADTNALSSGQFGDGVRHAVRPTPVQQRSLSAITFAGTAELAPDAINYHNVIFSDNYEHEFASLAADTVPTQPTTYLCAPDYDTDGQQRLFVLINAPANGDRFDYDTRAIAAVRHAASRQLAQSGIKIDLDTFEATTPNDFHTRYPATGGALYGPAMHGWRAAFRRPGSRTAVQGLYVAGGSVHPGSGVPMAALSGRLCAESILADIAAGLVNNLDPVSLRQNRAIG